MGSLVRPLNPPICDVLRAFPRDNSAAKDRWSRPLMTWQSPMRLRFTLLFAMLLMSAARAAPAPQAIEIPLASGTLHGQLYKPDGDGPFPTIIALHGCGGLGGHSDPVLPRYRDWTEQ